MSKKKIVAGVAVGAGGVALFLTVAGMSVLNSNGVRTWGYAVYDRLRIFKLLEIVDRRWNAWRDETTAARDANQN